MEFGDSFRKTRWTWTRRCQCRRGRWLAFWSRTKPDDCNVSAELVSNELDNLLRNLLRSSEKLSRKRTPSVSVLMMPTGVNDKLSERDAMSGENRPVNDGVRRSVFRGAVLSVFGGRDGCRRDRAFGFQLDGHVFDTEVGRGLSGIRAFL